MSRLSTIYRSGGTGRRLHAVQADAFPVLDFQELSVCLQSCDFVASEELVSRPTSQYVRSLFEQFLDTFVGLTPGHILQKTLGKDMALNDENDDLQEDDDTAHAMGLVYLFKASNLFLRTCGVHDFTIMDLMKPEPQRTKRHLSAVINYARFREENMPEVEQMALATDAKQEKVRKVREENAKLALDTENLKAAIQGELMRTDKNSLKQTNAYNAKLEHELRKLQKIQQLLTQEHNQYREQKTRFLEKLEDQHYLILDSNNELDKLRSYLTANPELLSRVIEDLKTQLADLQTSAASLENESRNKSTTIESIQIIEQELKSLFRILEEILNDIDKLEKSVETLNRFHEHLEHQRLQINDLNRRVQQVRRQLTNYEQKIENVKDLAEKRDAESKQNLAKLKADYDDLVEERSVKEQELDKKKELISDLEARISARRTEFLIEKRNAESAVARLCSHVKLYMAEMNKRV